MTFKDLQKVIESQPNSKQNNQLQKLRGKPFWIWDKPRHKASDRVDLPDMASLEIVIKRPIHLELGINSF
ncbi:MAG: hypothetical protein WAM27_05990 [Nitrososphaeraceae archaeon]